MTLDVDPAFYSHFRNLKQVFLYITDECNLRCVQCLYKPNLMLGRWIEPSVVTRLLRTFREMGAFKLTFLGGEVSLYGKRESWRPLLQLIDLSKELGYSYVRIDTNGQFSPAFLKSPGIRLLDEISFSLDGYDPSTNDCLRGAGTFTLALARLRDAINLGYNVHVTTCVTRQNSQLAGSASSLIDRMIRFAESEGVKTVNLHGVFRMGVPMDAWTQESHTTAEDWMTAFENTKERINKGEYKIHIRLPAHVIGRSEFHSSPKYYGYCPAKLGERVLVHPNGLIRICSAMLCTPYCVGRYDAKTIRWETVTNELYRHDLQAYTPCTNQRALYNEEFVPVCFSLKPKQRDPVWETLGYDSCGEENRYSEPVYPVVGDPSRS